MIVSMLLVSSMVQTNFSFHSPDKSLSVVSEEASTELLQDSSYKLLLSSKKSLVRVSAAKQGIELRGLRVNCLVAPDSRDKKSMRVSQAAINGGAYIFRKMPDGFAATLTATKANFRDQIGFGTADVQGNVYVEQQSPKDKQQLTMRGTSGTVTFAMDGKSGHRGLLTGLVNGPVEMHVVQESPKPNDPPTIINAKGRQILVNGKSVPLTVTVLGVTSVTGLMGSGTAELNGRQKLVITLNDDNRATKLELTEDKS